MKRLGVTLVLERVRYIQLVPTLQNLNGFNAPECQNGLANVRCRSFWVNHRIKEWVFGSYALTLLPVNEVDFVSDYAVLYAF